MTNKQIKRTLEALYAKYNHREFVSPDPLQWVYEYSDPADQEVAGLIAACLAFGSVGHIVRSVGAVLDRMPAPAACVRHASREALERTFAGFRHRFVGAVELCDLLIGIRRALVQYGSLGNCFDAQRQTEASTILPALTGFVRELRAGSFLKANFLLPSPDDGSACKRLNLFLRWMIRRDAVDPGVWGPLTDSWTPKLIVPLDTHMHRIALELGLTTRRQGDLRTAIEVTDAFRRIVPDDPARYDFALTRLGIRKERRPKKERGREGKRET